MSATGFFGSDGNTGFGDCVVELNARLRTGADVDLMRAKIVEQLRAEGTHPRGDAVMILSWNYNGLSPVSARTRFRALFPPTRSPL